MTFVTILLSFQHESIKNSEGNDQEICFYAVAWISHEDLQEHSQLRRNKTAINW
jgi:intergrase/recombinase